MAEVFRGCAVQSGESGGNIIIIIIIIIIITIIVLNIQGWAIWPVPSPELQLLSPSFLRSPNCSLSLWAVMV
jgi:hypothetical protein